MGMLLRAAVVLGLVLTGTGVVVDAPAQAAGDECTTQFSAGPFLQEVLPGDTDTVVLRSIGSPAGDPRGQVTDVDLALRAAPSYDQVGRHSADVVLLGPGQQMVLSGGLSTSGEQVDLRLDDEAPAPRPDGQPTGWWKPSGPLSVFDGARLPDSWAVRVHNTGRTPLRIESVTVTVDTNGCDPDRDSVPQYADNCPTVPNPDQLDWDRDGVGNACDATPGTDPNAPTPAPPTTPATPATPTQPGATGQPGTPSCTSSCAYARTVALRHVVRKHRLVGRVASVASGCRTKVAVVLWRERRGEDREVRTVRSSGTGAFRTRAPKRAGRYYATVASAGTICADATSPTVRVRRRH